MHLPEEIQHRISYIFKNAALLECALTHKSYANENRVLTHNERLEFLGDAVLNLIVSEHLMKACPDATEGDLSRLRAVVVSEPALASVARKIDLGSCLRLGKGEELTGGREKDSLLGNSLEALLAAVYLDAGENEAKKIVIRLFDDFIKKKCALRNTLDYKTELQELCQERLKQLPEYRIISESGPDHRKQFEVELSIKGVVYGRASGKNKKEAEQGAAKAALERFSQKNT